MALRHAGMHLFSKRPHVCRRRLGSLQFRVRRPVGIDAQLAVGRKSLVDLFGQFDESMAKIGDQRVAGLGDLDLGTIDAQPLDTFGPRRQLRAVVGVGPGARHEQVCGLERLGDVREDADFQGPTIQRRISRGILRFDECAPALRQEAEIDLARDDRSSGIDDAEGRIGKRRSSRPACASTWSTVAWCTPSWRAMVPTRHCSTWK